MLEVHFEGFLKLRNLPVRFWCPTLGSNLPTPQFDLICRIILRQSDHVHSGFGQLLKKCAPLNCLVLHLEHFYNFWIEVDFTALILKLFIQWYTTADTWGSYPWLPDGKITEGVKGEIQRTNHFPNSGAIAESHDSNEWNELSQYGNVSVTSVLIKPAQTKAVWGTKRIYLFICWMLH